MTHEEQERQAIEEAAKIEFEKEIDYSQEHTISLKVRMPNMSGLNAGAISLKSVLLEFLA